MLSYTTRFSDLGTHRDSYAVLQATSRKGARA